MEDLLCISRLEQASALLDPLRLRVLEAAREPVSASDVARRLDLPRQRVNYHVRTLAKAGLLRRAGRRLKRNLAEQRYEATARAFLLLPELLGPVGVKAEAAPDAFSAAYLVATAARIQSEMARVEQQAAAQGKRVATLTLDAGIHFESAEQRREFTVRLERALVDVIAQYTSPAGRPFRLVTACYPLPGSDDPEEQKKETLNEP
jgi:DNA-binding transcriptional ArsR family regulator